MDDSNHSNANCLDGADMNRNQKLTQDYIDEIWTGKRNHRKFSPMENAVDTGPISFGDTNKGVFIAEDQAIYYASLLEKQLDPKGVSFQEKELIKLRRLLNGRR